MATKSQKAKFNPLTLRSKFEFSFVALFISHRSSEEKLIKYQANSSCMIMSIILMTTFMTTLFDKANIDITRRNLILITLRAKGLKSIFKVKSEKQKSKVDLRTRVYLHETGTNTIYSYFRTGLRPSDRVLIIACLVRIGLHTFLFMR